MGLRLAIHIFLAFCAGSAALQAHEFWIEPQAYQIAPDTPIVADIRVGENFGGSAYSFIPRSFRRFDLVHDTETVEVVGRIGDRPALSQETNLDGLHLIVHETTDNRLTYREWEKFVKFLTHKDALWVVEAHRARGLPDDTFREVYSRYAKGLVAVGQGAGADRPVGLEIEIVAGANPYVDDVTGGLPVQVLYQGQPRADAQVEVFAKAPDDSVEVTTTRTDAEGRVTIPVAKGHAYLLDSVVLREPAPDLAEAESAVWESVWASLTFMIPD